MQELGSILLTANYFIQLLGELFSPRTDSFDVLLVETRDPVLYVCQILLDHLSDVCSEEQIIQEWPWLVIAKSRINLVGVVSVSSLVVGGEGRLVKKEDWMRLVLNELIYILLSSQLYLF